MHLLNQIRIIVLLAAVAVIATIPVSVYATQETGPGEDGQKTRVTQEFTYKAGESPDIPKRINQFGEVLSLASVSEPVLSGSLPETRTYSYTVSSSYTPDQLAQAPKNVKLTPVYGTGVRQVDRREALTGLPNNDVESIPTRHTYIDTDGMGPGSSQSGELVLAEVKYELVGRDTDGIPNNYTAHVVYRGEETYTALMYYTATATYTTTTTEEGVATYTVVAVYEGEAPAAPQENIPEAEPPLGGTGSDGSAGPAIPGDQSGGANVWLPFSLGTISPLGAATFATIVTAILALMILGIFNRRRLRESH